MNSELICHTLRIKGVMHITEFSLLGTRPPVTNWPSENIMGMQVRICYKENAFLTIFNMVYTFDGVRKLVRSNVLLYFTMIISIQRVFWLNVIRHLSIGQNFTSSYPVPLPSFIPSLDRGLLRSQMCQRLVVLS